MAVKDAREFYLIAAITPYFLERGPLWFQENEREVLDAAETKPWWQERVLVLESDLVFAPGKLLAKFLDFGYEKVREITGAGEFAQRGGVIDVAPINRRELLRIEYHGNTMEDIRTLPAQILRRRKTWAGENLRVGDYVVHIDHGIGIFRGEEAKCGRRYFLIEYARPRPHAPSDRLLVPEEQQKKLSPYYGFSTPTIHRLGGALWPKTKRKAKESAIQIARELLRLYQKRARVRRIPYLLRDPLFEEFEAAFAFEPTKDQTRAVSDIIRDLASPKPMDRLLLGDVGFGKTEVAMRAAFLAALSGKQVAILAPTTILAEQHFETFRERFEKFALEVVMLSRLTPKRQEQNILENLARGTIDVLIGTHRLLSKDVLFKNLGLLIIDEEQRFGVKQKEKFKDFRAEVDILSLTATPIPRTLSLTLAKLREMSQLKTPPPGRLAVKTFVLPYSKRIVKEAIEAELARNGQIYFLWNRIETIGLVEQEVKKLVPKAGVGIIHGRLPEKTLAKAMHDFRAGKFDVLLATTIIENGLDLSNVNTLIVSNAPRLGLAQSYQLRGRIGRGDVQAYAYFLYSKRHLPPKAAERLQALQEAEALGSGFQIALRDLEIRGAGNVLGREQSGTVNAVGLNLYAHLLSEAVEELSYETTLKT